MGKFISVLIVVVLIGGGAWWFLKKGNGGGNQVVDQLFASVKEGPLVINMTESGSIRPAEQISIKSKVEGRVSILSLVPEGQPVKKGDILVELDSSSLQDNLVNQEITVQNAQASFVQASENLEVVKNQAKADVDKAELTLRFAKEDLLKYKDGEYPKSLNELESKVTLAAEELQRAVDKLKWSKTLFEEKYLSETEYKSDALSKSRCELDLATAKGNLALLQNYTYKRQVAQLESDVSQDEMALERTRRSANANVVQAEATLRAKELELNRQKARLEKIKDQIEKSTIRAPADGLVIYATSNRGPFRGNSEPLQEGQEVHERQELIVLPTADTFIAEIKVHETNLKKLYEGLPVRVRIDALPGQIFMGKVSKIAPLPDAQSIFMNPDLKLYNTIVAIEGGAGVLKSGMNCEAEVVIEQYEKAMYLPVQCVVREAGKPVVYLKTATGTEKREVEIGLDNNRMVRVISGLKVGDEVMLTPPMNTSVSLRASEEMIDADIPDRAKVEAARQARPPIGGGPGGGPAGGPAGGPGSGAGGERRMPQISPEMREKFEKMTPEERREFFMKMRERGGMQRPQGAPGEGGMRPPRNWQQRGEGNAPAEGGEGGMRPPRNWQQRGEGNAPAEGGEGGMRPPRNWQPRGEGNASEGAPKPPAAPAVQEDAK